jgi:fructose 1,6-bisphosphatase
MSAKKHDPVNSPRHYIAHPCGVECVDVAEHYSFNAGNAIKYLWRHLEKGKPVEDLRKAAWYATREATRLAKIVKP